jgi:hypothetical protein
LFALTGVLFAALFLLSLCPIVLLYCFSDAIGHGAGAKFCPPTVCALPPQLIVAIRAANVRALSYGDALVLASLSQCDCYPGIKGLGWAKLVAAYYTLLLRGDPLVYVSCVAL